jgi:hypothetical protein
MSEPLVTTHDSATHPQGVPRRVPPLHLITAVVLSTAAAVLVATLPATASNSAQGTTAVMSLVVDGVQTP